MRVSLPLEYSGSRPLIMVTANNKNIVALVDTGAEVPVFTKEEDLLQALGFKRLDGKHLLEGFGGSGVLCNIYSGTIRIGNIIYPNFRILAGPKRKGFGIVLSASMFSEFSMTIDNLSSTFILENNSNQTCYNITIRDDSGNSTVLENSFDEAMKLLTGGPYVGNKITIPGLIEVNSEPMTMEEISITYPHEWVVIEIIERNKTGHVIKARVLYRGEDAGFKFAEMCRAGNKNVREFYTTPEDEEPF